ncbi:MAG: PIG-L family deacetylase [Flavobacteriales bacterium]|nr:PIG-L family deacetylase [Flavobacteriales bacterium]
MANILVVAAHPDDEMIGAGGTLLKHIAAGDKVFWLIITGMSEHQGFSADRIASRAKEIDRVAIEAGFARTVKLNYPTMTLSGETLVDMVPKISAVFQEIQPETIYTMNRSDAHSDHRVIFDAVMACTKSFRYPYIKKVLMYETLSETEFSPSLSENAFVPNYFVDITPHFRRKAEISKIYESELGEHPFPRSLRNLEALAVFRGASCGVEYAEAFQLIRFIDK